jgi:hypothetical protein
VSTIPAQVDMPGRSRLMEAMDSVEMGFNYVCRRCDVWGRVPAGSTRRCWLCDGADRLERR